MPRIARVAPPDYVYHILTRGNNQQDVFIDDEDRMKYFGILLKYKEKYHFKLYHYVLMTNHVHLVLEPVEKGGNLAEIMKGINLSYAQHYKKKYQHTGHFWQDRYKSIIVSKDNYLLACGSYVELNPVRAGMVKEPKEYKWSSYNAYAYGKPDEIVDKHPIYRVLSNDEKERLKKYRIFVMGMLKNKNAMKGEMEKHVVYGNEEFVAGITKGFNIEGIIKPKGRPRKDED